MIGHSQDRASTVYPRSDIHQRTYYYHSSNHSTVFDIDVLFTNILFIDLLFSYCNWTKREQRASAMDHSVLNIFILYTLFIRA